MSVSCVLQTWVYISVVLLELCPKSCCIYRKLTPFSKRWVAKLCRKVCMVSLVLPSAFLLERLNTWQSTGEPVFRTLTQFMYLNMTLFYKLLACATATFVMRRLKICPTLNVLQQDTCKHLLRRHGQVSVKVFDYLAEQVAVVILLTAPSMRRTRCKRKVEVFTLFNQLFS